MISDDFDIGGNLANDKPASQGVLPLSTKKSILKSHHQMFYISHLADIYI